MRLLMLGLPHARATIELSHCAFSMKVRRWAPMMAPLGYQCVHLGVGEPDSLGWWDHIDVMSPEEQVALLGYDPTEPSPEFIGRAAFVGGPLYQEFNQRVARILSVYARPTDVICCPFGHGHQAAVQGHLAQVVETGVGYPICFQGYRIYESNAWMSWHLGRDGRHAWASEWVVPNYFDITEWPLRPTPPLREQYVLFFGRLIESKGLNVVWQLAKARPDLEFVICGQGDAGPWLRDAPNLHYHPPVHGLDRALLMHSARCLLVPTTYLEPFGGVAVEAMLTGTPVLTSDHGAFPETVRSPRMRCHTQREWLRGLDLVLGVDPTALRAATARRYRLEAVGPQYDRIFQQLPAMRRDGWSSRSTVPEGYEPCDFATIAAEEQPQAERVAAWAAQEGFGRVLDVGCGPGLYVTALQHAGLEAEGWDHDARIPEGPAFRRVDVTTATLTERADLALCLEVAEHLPEEQADALVESLTDVAPVLLFSAAIPGQGGQGHVNCQSKEYWLARFAARGFQLDTVRTARFLDYLRAGPHMGWLTQNAMILREVPHAAA